MKPLLGLARQFLAKEGYKPTTSGAFVRAFIQGDNGVWTVSCQSNEDDRWLVCRSILPCSVPEKLRPKAAMFVAQANYGTVLGSFELDMRDGEVAYKTAIRLMEDELTEAMLKSLLWANFSTFDRYLPGFMALIHGGRPVKHCIELVEGPPTEPNPLPQLPSPSAEPDSSSD